jgi:hypothetical protein
MVVCGLDQAPRGSGWCYGDGSKTPAFGYREFSDYGQNEGALARHVYDWFTTFAKSAGIQAVYTEQIVIRPHALDVPVVLRQAAVVVAIGFAATDLGIDHYEALIGKWRVHFLRTAKGKSETLKDLARVRCAERGWLIDNHHVAEACGIWDWGLCELDRVYRHRSGHHRRRAENADDARKVA